MTLYLDPNLTADMITTAGPALVRVRAQEPEFPPTELDAQFDQIGDGALDCFCPWRQKARVARGNTGRGDRTRTCGLLLPKQAR